MSEVIRIKKRDLDKSLFEMFKLRAERKLFLKKSDIPETSDDKYKAYTFIIDVLKSLQGEKYDA